MNTVPETPAGPAGVDTSAVRRLNTSAALRAFLALDGPATLAQLTGATALSRRTVEAILDELIAAGWAEELEPSASGGAGRPSRRFAVHADNALVAALRIDTSAATALVSDVRGRELGRASSLLPDYFDPTSSVATAVSTLHEALRAAGADAARLRGGALATGGAVGDEAVIERLVHAPHWAGFDARAALASHLELPWFVDNDANLAALAERWQGAAVDQDTLVWLIAGNRTGAGILVHGEVHRGFRGAAGELIEAATLDVGRLQDHPVAWLTSPRAEERARARALVDAARAGDAEALALVDELVEQLLVPLLVTLSWTIAPPLFVLGGGLEYGGELLLGRIAAGMRRAGAPDIPLAATRLGLDAPLRGALKLTLDRLDAELLGPTLSGSLRG